MSGPSDKIRAAQGRTLGCPAETPGAEGLPSAAASFRTARSLRTLVRKWLACSRRMTAALTFPGFVRDRREGLHGHHDANRSDVLPFTAYRDAGAERALRLCRHAPHGWQAGRGLHRRPR